MNDSITWADSKHPLARFLYQTFDESDYDTYIKQYLTNPTQVKLEKKEKTSLIYNIFKPPNRKSFKDFLKLEFIWQILLVRYGNQL